MDGRSLVSSDTVRKGRPSSVTKKDKNNEGAL